jgi:PhzF family phenazine biosynthesis protein
MNHRSFNFWKLDAFTNGASSGNPAGLVLLDAGQSASETEMQRLATQVAGSGFVTEVAFARRVGPGELELRYFSREREVPFCGHATVASVYHLLANTEAFRGLPHLSLRTSQGVLVAENRIEAEDCVFIAAPAPAYPEIRVTRPEAASALGLALGALDDSGEAGLPVCQCGLKSLLVAVRSLEAVLACTPDYTTLRTLVEGKGLDVVVLYTRETHRADRVLRTRVFPPVFGYLEDPATGSGNAALAHWLRRSGAWSGETLAIEQGPDRSNPNLITIRANPAGGLQIGGRAVVRIAGQYLLH